MKILCPHCETEMEVSSKEVNLVCHSCGKSFDIYQAKEVANKKYRDYSAVAYNFLFKTQDYKLALENYEKALKFKDHDLSSIVGICLSKISAGTFEDAKYSCVKEELEKHDIYLDLENTVIFLHFIKDTLDTIEYYYGETDGRLIKDDTFINQHLFDCYVKNLLEIKEVLAYFKDAFEVMVQDEIPSFEEQYPSFRERFENVTNENNNRLNGTYNVNEIGDVKLTNGEKSFLKENVKQIEFKELETLNIVRINERGIKLMKMAVPFAGIITTVGLVLALLYIKLKNIPLLIIGIILVLSGVGTFFLFRYFAKKTY